MKVTATFRRKKETKGAVLYQEVSASKEELSPYHPDAIMGTPYVRKQIFNGKALPPEVKITIEWPD
jgi:hypothetical protein